VHALITDSGAPPDMLAMLRDAGVNVIVAEVGDSSVPAAA
jgi:hypothetical protein